MPEQLSNRRSMRVCCFLLITLAACDSSKGSELRAVVDENQETSVRILGLAVEEADWLGKLSVEQLQTVLRVYVHESESAGIAVFGECRVVEGRLKFVPRFPLRPGLDYRVVYDAVVQGRDDGQHLVQLVRLPEPDLGPPGSVTAVFPTTDDVPENQLKFYIHFSVPMSRGEAYERIHLYEENGREVKYAFLELHGELWDPHGKRFTLLFDPGRVKRELTPRLTLGPSIQRGKEYRLVIDRDWNDADGRPLKTGYRKRLRVGRADYSQPSTGGWQWSLPKAGSKDPLRLTFAEPLDHAMLQRVIQVLDARDQIVTGEIQVTNRETVWEFVPDSTWRVADYALQIDAALEDRAGNSLGRPFEVDEFRQVDRRVVPQLLTLPFAIK